MNETDRRIKAELDKFAKDNAKYIEAAARLEPKAIRHLHNRGTYSWDELAAFTGHSREELEQAEAPPFRYDYTTGKSDE